MLTALSSMSAWSLQGISLCRARPPVGQVHWVLATTDTCQCGHPTLQPVDGSGGGTPVPIQPTPTAPVRPVVDRVYWVLATADSCAGASCQCGHPTHPVSGWGGGRYLGTCPANTHCTCAPGGGPGCGSTQLGTRRPCPSPRPSTGRPYLADRSRTTPPYPTLFAPYREWRPRI